MSYPCQRLTRSRRMDLEPNEPVLLNVRTDQLRELIENRFIPRSRIRGLKSHFVPPGKCTNCPIHCTNEPLCATDIARIKPPVPQAATVPSPWHAVSLTPRDNQMKIAKNAVEYLSAVVLAGAIMASNASAQQSTTTTTTTTVASDQNQAATVPTSSQITVAPSAAGTASAEQDQAPLKLNSFIVTGTTTPITQIEASYDVSVVPHMEIVTTPAVGLAGLADSIPGFYGESSGGQNGQNLTVDGLRDGGGFFEYISVQEDGLPLQYNGFYVEYQLQPDASFGSVEVVTAGPSAIFAPEGAAATMNWISRMPSIDSGDVTFSVTSEGEKRFDFFYGGPLPFSKGWSGSVGGFYQSGQGVRPVGYTMGGGQIRAKIEKTFEGGSFSVAYKFINNSTPYYWPEPVIENSQGVLSSIPGFNVKQDTLYSVDRQKGDLVPPTGYGAPVMGGLDQIGAHDLTSQITVKFDKELGGGWSVSNGFRIGKTSWIDSDDRHGGNSDIFSAAAYTAAAEPLLASFAQGLAGASPVTSTQLVQVTGANSGMVINNPSTLNGNGLLWVSDQFQYHEDQLNTIDDLRLAWKTDNNKLTLGYMYLDNNITNDGAYNNAVLADVRNHVHLYDVQGLNSAGKVVDHLTLNGVLEFDDSGGGPTSNIVPGASAGQGYYAEGSVDTLSSNFYFDDEFQITKQLHIDAGFRYEQITWNNQVTPFSALVGDGVGIPAPLPIASTYPNVIAAQQAGVWAAPNAYVPNSSSVGDYSWSIGANYQFNSNFSAFARESRSYDPGVQDFVVYFGGTPTSNSSFAVLHFSQAGLKYESSQFAADVTGFYAVSDNNPQAEQILGQSQVQTYNLSYISYGANFDLAWKPNRNFRFEVSGEIGHSAITNISGITVSGDENGKQIDRVPDVEVRFKPTYYFGRGKIFASANYYGQRYGDLANTQKLGAYTNLQAGISYDITNWMNIDIEADNLLNSLAFTEGNSVALSSLNAGSSGYAYARAISGTNAKASLTIRF